MLNRCTVEKPYRGFESLPLRHFAKRTHSPREHGRKAAFVIITNDTIALRAFKLHYNKARRFRDLQSGFEVIACDGKQPGCFDLHRDGILKALHQLKSRARRT